MAAISVFGHRVADSRGNTFRSILRTLLLSVFVATQIFVLAATADCSNGNIVINDINRTLSASEKASLITLVEKQIRFHRTHSGFKTPVTLNIRLFTTKNDYVAYRKQNSTSPSDSGYYSNRKKEIVTHKATKGYFKTLLHESQHALFRLTGAKAPKWLNEGLSQFFEQSYVENGTIFIKAGERDAAKVKKYRERNSLTPLSKLVNLTDKEWDSQFKGKEFQYYYECWSLIYFLMTNKNSRDRHDLVYILRDLKKGSKLTTLQAINHRYPGGINALERDWREFIKNSNFKIKIRYPSD
jgi:hypothetical protein